MITKHCDIKFENHIFFINDDYVPLIMVNLMLIMFSKPASIAQNFQKNVNTISEKL